MQYKIDRLNLTAYKSNRRKLRSLKYRYLAKSQIVRHNAIGTRFQFVNFRGSRFLKVRFDRAYIQGCDFWGATFKDCKFVNTTITDSVFMSCTFINCSFMNTTMDYTAVVNTEINFEGLSLKEKVAVLHRYPEYSITHDLAETLAKLYEDMNLRKCKLLNISRKKYNLLNLVLLENKFPKATLAELLKKLSTISTKEITTYKKMELALLPFYKNPAL